MTYALNPGCCCDGAPTCILFQDDFERADSSSLGSDWTEALGNWSISSGALTVASTFVPGVVVSAAAPSTQNYRMRWFFTSPASGTKIRAIFGYVDTSNYYFAELYVNSSGYVKIYQKAAGVDTQLAVSQTIDTTATTMISLCYSGTYLSANIGVAASFVSAEISAPSGTELFGVSVVNPISAGDVLFSSMDVYEVSESCANCNPGNCCAVDEDSPFEVKCIFDEDGPPIEIRVVISGAVAGGGGCSWCNGDPANGDWIATNVIGNDPCDRYTENPCFFAYVENIPQSADACIGGNYACHYALVVSFVWIDIGSTYRIAVTQTYYPSSVGLGHDCTSDPCGDSPSVVAVSQWATSDLSWPAGGISSISLSGVSLTLSLSNFGSCDFSGATCTLTVLS